MSFAFSSGCLDSACYNNYSVYDLLCMYWDFSQQLEYYRSIDNDLDSFEVRSIYTNQGWILQSLEKKWVKTLSPLEYVLNKFDLLDSIFNPNQYEVEENYLGFLQKKLPSLMKEKNKDKRIVNKLLFKVHFENKNRHYKKDAKLYRRRFLLSF